MITFDNTEVAFASQSKGDLQRTYFLFRFMGNQRLIKLGIGLLNFAMSTKLPVNWLIKRTIFKQFCGGTSISDCDARIADLGAYHVKTILDYSVEGKETESDFDQGAQEIVDTILKGHGDRNIPFAVFKISGTGEFALLEKVSSGQALTAAESESYDRVKGRVNRICKKAHELNNPVFIDAEESWIQDAIDEIALDMMRKYNKEKAIVYNTSQMYRWDRMDYLKDLKDLAQQEGFKVGIKLVRGAYMEKERERAAELNYPSPIQKTKADSDRDFDASLKLCVEHLDLFSICCGTHNEESSLLLVRLMEEKGISKNDPRIYFAQLLGMSDHISYNLSKNNYNVAKYVPYGPITDVIPYLIRRAQENTSISGQTGRELSLILKEKQRRSAS